MTDYAIIQGSLSNLFEPQISEASSSYVGSNSYRLDAGVYSSGALSVKNLLKSSTKKFTTLSSIADVFGFGPFKRTYIEDSEFGIPLLSSSEIMELEPTPKFMAKADNPKWTQYQIRQRWILVSCSGTIGNIAIAPKKWDGWGVSQDAIRVLPQKGHLGFIYSFLRLPWMKELIVGKKSGSVIDHIYEDDLKRIEVPIPNEYCIDELESTINKVLNLREESDEHLSKANSLITEINALAELRKEATERYDPNRNIESVLISSSEVLHNNHSGSEYRLDAHFYNPLAQLAMGNIRQSKSKVTTIGDVTERVFFLNRFARTFVNEDHGIPYLAGSDIIKIRPANNHFLSKTQTNNLDQYLLHRGWILLTCSGTIGRTTFVWRNLESHAATHDLIRIIPNAVNIDAGYLYAFLSSQYGKQQVLRFTHGSVIDHITPEQVKKVFIPLPSNIEQKTIGDLVRTAYEKRAEAIRLEDEAQKILMDALTQ